MASYVNVPQLNIPVSDPLEQLGRVAQLKSMVQEQGLRNQQMQNLQQQMAYQQQLQPMELEQQRAATFEAQQGVRDVQASQRAMAEAGNDPDQYISLMSKYGASYKTILGMQKGIMDYRKSVADKNKIDLENQAATFDKVSSQFDIAKQNFTKDPQLAAQAWDRGLTMAEEGDDPLIQKGQISHDLPSSTQAIDTVTGLTGFHSKI